MSSTMPAMGELRGRSALVTGAGSGLGKAIALKLAAEGAVVTAAGRRAEALAKTVSEGPAGAIVSVRGDVTLEDDRARMVAASLERTGRLDVLVNAAGILEAGSIDS